jgi:putative heme iron utilization protein
MAKSAMLRFFAQVGFPMQKVYIVRLTDEDRETCLGNINN